MRKTGKVFAVVLALVMMTCQVPGIAAAETTTQDLQTEATTESNTVETPEGSTSADAPKDSTPADAPKGSTPAEDAASKNASVSEEKETTESGTEPASEAQKTDVDTDEPDAEKNSEADGEALESNPAQETPARIMAAPLRAQAETDTVIENVTINVTTPTDGSKNVDASTIVSVAADTPYSIRSAYWVGNNFVSADSDDVAPDGLQTDEQYAISVTLTAKTGYIFEGDTSTFTVTGTNAVVNGGNEVFIVGHTPTGDEGIANIKITPVANSDTTIPTQITSVTIDVTPPEAGTTVANAQSAASVPSDANYTIDSIAYYYEDPRPDYDLPMLPDQATLAAGYTVYAWINFSANDGCVFRQASPGTAINITGSGVTLLSGTPLDVTNIAFSEDFIMSYSSCLVSFTIPDEEEESDKTVDMHVWTPGHGKLLIKGADYGTEFRGTWYEGTDVSIEAVPDSGYRLDYWWIRKASEGGDRVAAVSTTLTAGTHPEAVAYFGLETAALTITAPAAGQTAAAKPQVTLPAGAGYSIDNSPDSLLWVESGEYAYHPAALDPSTTFEAGKTYYAKVRLRDGGAARFAATAGGSTFDTDLSVSGGEKQWQSNSANREEAGEGEYVDFFAIDAVIAVTIPKAPGVSDAYVDNTADSSVSYVTGNVHITGSGGTQAGYNTDDTGKTVYSNQENVTYSNPRTARVQGMIDEAYTQVYTLANACKDNGSSGEFEMSTGESTGRVWDNRRYKTYVYNPATGNWENTVSGKTEVYTGEIPANAGTNTRIHVASGDFGKETFYSVEANGRVDGYSITVTDDGNGTAGADLETSLAGETVTLTASPTGGYKFREWQIVSGGAVPESTASASTTFTMPAADVEVKAVFESTHVHDWDAPAYTWSSDNKTVTATRVCKDDASHVETETVNTTSEVTKAATCSAKGETTYTATFTNTAFATQTKTIEDVAIDVNAHDWGAWKVTKEATETEEGEETRTCSRCDEIQTQSIPRLVVKYRNTDGDGSTWEKGSSKSLEFVFKRNINDETSFSHFTGIQVDGTVVDPSNYTAVSGSVVVNLKAAFLETLSAGKHTIAAQFEDGNNPSAKFTITEKKQDASKDSKDSQKNTGADPNDNAKSDTKTNTTVTTTKAPATGDNNNIVLWGIVMIASLLCLVLTMISRRSRSIRGRSLD